MSDTTNGRCRHSICQEAKAEVAREIFEEIEAALAVHTLSGKSEDYADGALDTLEWVDTKLAEIKKKYMEGAKSD